MMNYLSKTGSSLKTLNLVHKRYSTREAIHRYVEPNKFKKHLLTATQPYFKRKFLSPEETCKGHNIGAVPLLPLEKIYVEELIEDIKNNNFILFIQYTFTEFQSERVYKNNITKSGGTFHSFNNRVYKEAFKMLNKNEVLSLFITRNALVTGKDNDLVKCVNAIKKMPQFLMLAGYIDGHLYNYEQLLNMSDLKTSLLRLTSLLSSSAINLSATLEHHSELIKSNDDTQSEENK